MSGWSGGPAQARPHFLPELDLYPDIAALEETAGIAPKTPALLDLSKEGHLLDEVFQEFLRRSKLRRMDKGTRETYCKVYLPVLRWLADRPTPRRFHEMDANDLHDWKAWRTDVLRNPGAIGRATWNKEATALGAFFEWAVAHGYMLEHPFMDYGPNLRFRGNNVQGRPAGVRMSGARTNKVDWISAETFRLWLSTLRGDLLTVSESGVLVPGGEDNRFRGRNTQRNSTFCDFIYGTGCRLEETTRLLACEIPVLPAAPRGFAEMRVPSSIAKYEKTRMIFLSWWTVGVVARYVAQERAHAVAIGRSKGRYSSGGWTKIEEVRRRRGVVEVRLEGRERWTSHDQLQEEQRARLLIEGPSGWEPAALWLNEMGLPLNMNDMSQMFTQANKRWTRLANAAGYRGDVPYPTPQTFRRSWAMNWLIIHHRVIDERLGDSPSTYEPSRYEDAFRAVQLQLGHSSLETTMNYYLHAVKDLRGLNIFKDASLKAVYKALKDVPVGGANVLVSLNVNEGDDE